MKTHTFITLFYYGEGGAVGGGSARPHTEKQLSEAAQPAGLVT